MPAVDAYVSLAHYADHIVDAWRELPDDTRGTFWCAQPASVHLRRLGIAHQIGRPRPQRGRLTVVAGGADAQILRAMPVALVEHGAGQAYDVDNPGWSGGSRRGNVVLFLCPNEQSAARNRIAYPDAHHEVVGSPRVERLRSFAGSDRAAPPTAVLSFHWPCPFTLECGWALPHYEDALPSVIAQLRIENVNVVGHGHPRASRHFARLWRRLGVEHLEHFDDVVRRADVYVCDNSSTMFEAAACGIPVVALNAPWYRRDADLWPRFWACAGVGRQCDIPAEVFGAVVTSLSGPPPGAAAAVGQVYPLIEGSARRSAAALVAASEEVAARGATVKR